MRLPQHSYEEVRDVVVSILMQRDGPDYPTQYTGLVSAVAMHFHRLQPAPQGVGPIVYTPFQDVHPADEEAIRDVFWDLFRQGYITLGYNSSNPAYPFFRLSRFGRENLGVLSQNRFHDTGSYMALVKERVADLAPETETYLEEAVAAFYAGCYLSTCVMLGVAAETEFLRLIDVAAASPKHPGVFDVARREGFVKTKIDKFQRALAPLRSHLQPRKNFENLDTNLTTIQAVLRVARNDAGHPTGARAPDRDQVFVYLHLFPTLGEQMAHLRIALS